MNTSHNPLSILLADDHQLVVDGIKSMLAAEIDYLITAEAGDGREALDLISADPGRFQLLIADVSMPVMTGLELCKMVKSQHPQIKVLILSMYNNVSVVKEAISAEADGYILKNTGKGEFLKALQRITDGGTYFSQDIIPVMYNQYVTGKEVYPQLSSLTPREKEILILISRELTSGEIGTTLSISKKTVDTHRAHLLEKTNSRSTVGLLKFAIRAGLVDLLV